MGQNVEKALLAARKHVQRGKTAEAEAVLQGLLDRFPGNRRAMKALDRVRSRALGLPDNGLPEIRDLLGKGAFAEAISMLHAPLMRQPDNVELLLLHADALSGLGRHEDAIEVLAIAQGHANDSIEIALRLGRANMTLGRPDTALGHFWRASELRPQAPGPLVETAMALAAGGRQDTAISCLHRARDLAREPAQLSRVAEGFEAIGDWEAALRLHLTAAETARNLPDLWIRLGVAATSVKLHPVAETAFIRAAELAPTGPADIYLGDLFFDAGAFDQAADVFERRLAANPASAQAMVGLARVKYALDAPGAAIALCQRALELRPSLTMALRVMADARLAQGDVTGAEDDLRRALALEPDSTMIANALVTILPPDRISEVASVLTRGIESVSTPLEHRVSAHFGLSRIAAEAGKPDEAVAHLDQAGVHILRHAPHDPAGREAELRHIEALFSTRLPALQEPSPLSFTPVFVVGMPRSGTTLVEQMLNAHRDVGSIGESTALAQAVEKSGGLDTLPDAEQLAAIREAYLASVAGLLPDPAGFITDKMPMNFRYAGIIAAALPEARIVHLVRSPEAICWSCFRTKFKSSYLDFTYDQRLLGRYFAAYRSLMARWRRSLPGQVRDLEYEALTEAPEHQMRALLDDLGLGWDGAVLAVEDNARPIRTASVLQVRQPIYRGSSSRWKAYAPWLGPLLEELRGPS